MTVIAQRAHPRIHRIANVPRPRRHDQMNLNYVCLNDGITRQRPDRTRSLEITPTDATTNKHSDHEAQHEITLA